VLCGVATPNNIDLYYAIKGKKKRAKVYLVASKGYDNYIADVSDATSAGSISSFFQQLDYHYYINI
jgi:hypothetical protein